MTDDKQTFLISKCIKCGINHTKLIPYSFTPFIIYDKKCYHIISSFLSKSWKLNTIMRLYVTTTRKYIYKIKLSTFGRARPKKTENPSTKRFLAELRSTNWRVEKPTAVIMANMTQNTPPTTGSGMVTNRAHNLPSTPTTIIMTAPICTTRRLPTCRNVMKLERRLGLQ